MKDIFVLFCLLATALPVIAQNDEFGTLSTSHLSMTRYSADSNAHAVVLSEVGDARIAITEQSQVIMEYRVRIKILDDKGFESGNVVIPVYKSNRDRFEHIRYVSGNTNYIDENGKVVTVPLDPKGVIKENKNQYWDHYKFTMPDLRPGCVIEYSYELTSPFIFNFRSWTFQSDIPKVKSLFKVSIPGIYQYHISSKGPFRINQSEPKIEQECFVAGNGLKAQCLKINYSLDSIPAFREEAYMTAASNFISSVNFELSEYYDASGVKHALTKEWKNVDSELRDEEKFGKQLQKKDLFPPEV